MDNLVQQDKKAMRWRGWILAFILLIALGLRLWGIRFGLPYIYHFDEHFYIATALKLGAGIIHNTPYAPTGYSNILFGEYTIYYFLGKALGLFSSTELYEAAYHSDPTNFYLLARVTTAVFGSLTVFILYKWAKATTNWIVGLMAAAILAVSFLHMRDSHYAVPDIATTFFVALAALVAAAAVRQNSPRYLYLASLAAGYAFASKWTALPIIAIIWWASVCVNRQQRPDKALKLISRIAIWAGFLFFIGFALGAPQILINPTLYLQEASGQYGSGQSGGFDRWQVDVLPGWLFYGKTLLYGFGLVPLALSLVGIGRRVFMAVAHKDRQSVLLLIFPLLYYLLMGSTYHYFARYSLPLFPFLAFFAAEMIYVIVDRLADQRPGRRWGWILVALLVTTLAQPVVASLRHNHLLTQQDTRTEALGWIEANISEGAKLAVDWETHVPPLSTADKAMPNSQKAYDVAIIGGSGLAEHSIDWYREQGFDYLIATSFIYNIPLVKQERNTARNAFYASLDRELELVYLIQPTDDGTEPDFIFDEIYGPAISLWQRERPGPTLKIYRLNQ